MRIITASNVDNRVLGEVAQKVLGIHTAEQDAVSGGMADKMSIEDIAKKHGVEVSMVQKELKMGIEVELEHTNDKKLAEEIASDHLVEFPDYYTVLLYMEKVKEEAIEEELPEDLCPFAYRIAKKFIESTQDDWNYITPEEYHDLSDKEKDKFYLLDIRKPEDFAKGHIAGAENIFWLDLFSSENLKKLPRDKTILVYCYVGHTSSQALVLLRALGFDVVSMKFGMGISPVEGIPVAGWLNLGYDVQS